MARRGAQGHDLEVKRGEVVAIIGKSGSGKSTLLRCINGLESFPGRQAQRRRPAAETTRAGSASCGQDVGMVFQSFNLFSAFSVGRNVMLAPTLVKKARRPRRATRALAARTRGPGRQVRRPARTVVGRPAATRGDRRALALQPARAAVR